MSWDENLFGWLVKRGKGRERRRTNARSFPLTELRGDAEWLASAILGEPVHVRWAVPGETSLLNVLALPERLTPAPDASPLDLQSARSWLTWRILMHACQSRDCGASNEGGPPNQDQLRKWCAWAREEYPGAAAAVEQWQLRSEERLPGEESLWPGPIRGVRWDAGGLEPASAALEGDQDEESSQNNSSAGSLPARTALNPETVKLNRQQENPLVHFFEKLLTADEHQGGSKRMDGTDELQAHREALDELTLRKTIRTRQTSDSVIDSETLLRSGRENTPSDDAVDPGQVFLYPEWFEGERRLRPDYCRLKEETPKALEMRPSVPTTRGPEARRLREILNHTVSESSWRNRQVDGPELDLDALVRWRSQRAQNGSVDRRIYLARKPMERSVAVLVLTDLSLSTDSFVKNQRVIEVIRTALFQLGEVFAVMDESIAFAGFQSFTRQDCRFLWLKRFDEPWKKGEGRVSAIRPDGYTRMGAPIRHAGRCLQEISARRKLLLLLSDSKPTDYDAYEGAHGVRDVRHAVDGLLTAGTRFRALSLTPERRPHVAQMYGPGAYGRVSSSEDIVRAVGDTVLRQLQQH